jgi:hypothetical protein
MAYRGTIVCDAFKTHEARARGNDRGDETESKRAPGLA